MIAPRPRAPGAVRLASARVGLAVTLTALAACAPVTAEADRPGEPPSPPAADPTEVFQALETRLLEATAARASFRITAEGVLTVALDGVLVLAGEESLSLDAAGTFGDRAVRVELQVADGWMTRSNGTDTVRERAPAHAKEAVLIGLTRMGLLHNLARLVAALPPDRAAGGVTDWVRAEDIASVAPADGRAGPGVRFRILVAGQESGDAALWLDWSGLPLQREQTVRFPQGEMRVREEFEWQ
jgi:hypothetical protein